MSVIADLRTLDSIQRHTVAATFLGWTLDAFDYFLLVMVMPAVADSFHVPIPDVAFALLLTLAFRPLGALVFGRLADRYGRRRILMIDVALYSVLGLACAFAPSLTVLLVLRSLFGIAMGGEWGIGASLAMESIPAHSRGIVSGILQSGYPCGYLLCAIAYGLLFNSIGWRGMFALGIIPALLVLYLRRSVPESPVFEQRKRAGVRRGVMETMRGRWKLLAYMIMTMAVFNAFSHGSQDVYPTFLKLQMHFDTHLTSLLTIILNLGALAGGLAFGQWSEKIGRRRAMAIACVLALPAIPLWSYGGSVLLLAIGAFWIQVAVQGAWGVVPGYLNELSPDDVRGTLPGFAYQLGNLLVSWTAYAMTSVAHAHGGNYAIVQSVWIGVVALLLAVLTWFGPEARGVRFGVTPDTGDANMRSSPTSA
ncbi:MAG: MFS transporter [Xanthomonadaceae bacterium]|nr:MFS transporter [Xanthomonadaceae bacterium]MDE2053113.1 MFS transporter [Xanthomonadaceae bacterium]MDE2223689.1 MFS transporter [Xanthomonadaceae bacterium]